MYLTAFIF